MKDCHFIQIVIQKLQGRKKLSEYGAEYRIVASMIWITTFGPAAKANNLGLNMRHDKSLRALMVTL